jgi:hypothetical protein
MLVRKNKHRRVLALLLLLLALAGCNSGGLTVEQYLAWFGRKGCPLNKTQEVRGYKYELHYVTPDFMALKEIPREQLTRSLLRNDLKERDGLYYFLLRITPAAEKLSELKDRESAEISWFSFGSQQTTMMIAGRDTMACKMIQFEPSMGILPYQSFSIGIAKPADSPNPDKDLVVEFYDKVNTGQVIRFKYNEEDFKKIPQYKLQ